MQSAAGSFNFGRVLSGWWWLLERDSARLLPFCAIWVGVSFLSSGIDFSMGLTQGINLLSTSYLVEPFFLAIACGLALDDYGSGINRAAGEASRRYLALLGAYILSMVGIVLGVIFLILPGLALAVFWCVWLPVLIAERKSPLDALRTSFNYVRSNFWPVCGLLAIYTFGMIIVLIFALALNLGSEAGEPGLGLAVDSGIAVITSILGTYLNVAIYRELTVSNGPDVTAFD